MFLMLSTSRLGKVIYNALLSNPKDVNRDFVSAQRITYPFLDLGVVWSYLGMITPEKRADHLAICFIGESDNADFGYGVVV
jgi:hypothetical protein